MKSTKTQTQLCKAVYNSLKSAHPLDIFATLEEVTAMFLVQIDPTIGKAWSKQRAATFNKFIAPALVNLGAIVKA